MRDPVVAADGNVRVPEYSEPPGCPPTLRHMAAAHLYVLAKCHSRACQQTYEPQHIEHWLVAHDTSPVTSQPLAHKHLVPNLTFERLIEERLHERLTPRSLFT